MKIYIKLLGATMFWGGTFVAGRYLTTELNIGPDSIAFLRFFLASVILVIVARIKEGKLPRLDARQFVTAVLLGMTGVFLYNFFFFRGLSRVEAGRAALIIATCPIFITFFSAIIFRERISAMKIVGIVTSVTGAIVVISRGDPRGIFRGQVGLGELQVLCCVLCWCAYSLIGKAGMARLSPLVLVAYSSVLGTVGLLVTGLYHGLGAEIGDIDLEGWWLILYFAVCATVLGFLWYYEAVRELGAMRAGQFINFVPLWAIFFEFVFLREIISGSVFAGAVLVIGGAYMTNRKVKTGSN